jgi:uncharacterized protein (TIGR01741 family)
VIHLETQVIESIYQEIANKVNVMIPEQWDKLFLYTQVDEPSTVYFYYYPIEQETPVYYLEIPKRFEVERREVNDRVFSILDLFRILQEEFRKNKQELWTNLTFILESTGKFKIDYSYEDLSKVDFYEQHIIWRYKYLGMKPSSDRKRDLEILEKYLKSL